MQITISMDGVADKVFSKQQSQAKPKALRLIAAFAVRDRQPILYIGPIVAEAVQAASYS